MTYNINYSLPKILLYFFTSTSLFVLTALIGSAFIGSSMEYEWKDIVGISLILVAIVILGDSTRRVRRVIINYKQYARYITSRKSLFINGVLFESDSILSISAFRSGILIVKTDGKASKFSTLLVKGSAADVSKSIKGWIGLP